MKKLDAVELIARSYFFLASEWRTLFRLTLPLIVLSYAIEATADLYFRPLLPLLGSRAPYDSSAAPLFPAWIAVWVVIGVTLTRLVLLDDRKMRGFLGITFGKTEGLYVLANLGQFLAALAISMIINVAAKGLALGAQTLLGIELAGWGYEFFKIAGIVAAIFVWLRLSLAAPMAVAQQKLPLREAWGLTDGNSLRLLAGVLAAASPSYLSGVLNFVYGRTGLLQMPAGILIRELTHTAALFCTVALTVSVVGNAYLILSASDVEAPEAEAAQQPAT